MTHSSILLKIALNKVTEDNSLMESELSQLRQAELNKSYTAQCEIERLEQLLKDKTIDNEIFLKQIASLKEELSAINPNSNPNSSQTCSSCSRKLNPVRVRTLQSSPSSSSSVVDCSSLVVIPSTSDISDTVEDQFKKYPIKVIARDQLSSSSLPSTLNLPSNISSLSSTVPCYLIEWKSSVLSYSQFAQSVCEPLKDSLLPSSSSSSSEHSFYYSMSSLETLLQQINTLPHFLIDEDNFGRLLLDNGIPLETLLYWTTNPMIGDQPLFNSFNGLNRFECLLKALEINSSEMNKECHQTHIQNINKSNTNKHIKEKHHTIHQTIPSVKKEQLTQSHQEILDYEAELMSLIPRINGRFPSLSQWIESLDTQINTLQHEKKELQHDKEKLQTEQNNLIEDNRTLMKQLEKVIIQLEEKENQTKLEERIHSLELTVIEQKNELQTQQIIIQSHVESIVRFQSTEQELKQENKQLNEELLQQQEKYNLLKIQNSHLNDLSKIYPLLLQLEQQYTQLLPQLNTIENHILEENSSKSVTQLLNRLQFLKRNEINTIL